jgi:hypothetical protein
MNKWIALAGTLLISVVFSSTIKTTITNPSGSNLVISGILGILIIVGLWVFNKSDKMKPKKYNDGFTPAN